jgi:MFS family permease
MTGDEGPFSRGYGTLTAGFTAVMFLTGFAALAVVPTLPLAVRALQGVALYSLVAGGFVAASLLGGILAGRRADREGARRPLAVGVVLSVLTLLVSATSTSIWQLAAGRFFDGVAGGMVAVSINAAIGQSYPERLRPRVLALMSAAWVVPSLVGPPVAGLVADWWGWRAVFFALAGLTLIPALVVTSVLRKPPGSSSYTSAPSVLVEGSRVASPARRPSLIAAAAVSVGAALAQYGVSGAGTIHLVCAVLGVGLLAFFVSRLVPTGVWHAARGLPATVLLRALSSGSYFTLEAFVPLLLDAGRHIPAAITGLGFTGAALAWAAASWAQGHLLQGIARQQVVRAGALVLAAADLLALVGSSARTPAFTAAAALILAGAGMGMLVPTLTMLALSHSPADRQGYASAAMQTMQNLGQVIVMGLAAAVFAAASSPGGGSGGGSGSGPDGRGYAAVFALLLVPSVLAAVFAARARGDAEIPDPTLDRAEPDLDAHPRTSGLQP